MAATTAAEYAAGLRQLADMIEANPDIRTAYLDRPSIWCPNSADEVANIIRAGKAAGAQIEKEHSPDQRNVGIRFGAVKAMALVSKHQVCERVVVGTETVEVPDPEFIPPATPTVPREIDVIEWRCRPLLAGDSE